MDYCYFRFESLESGGDSYFSDILNNITNVVFKPIEIRFRKDHKFKILRKWFAIRRINIDSKYLLDFSSAISIRKKFLKNSIIIFHHFDINIYRIKFFYKLIYRYFIHRAKLSSKVIVVSEFWKLELKRCGINNIQVIYNSLDWKIIKSFINKFDKGYFVNKYGIDESKTIIYLGNNKHNKGVEMMFDILRDYKSLQLICSGTNTLNLNLKTIKFEYIEFLNFLRICDISVIYSELLEGWNRVAMESLAVGTPVIGSPKGGLKELLLNSGQFILEDPKGISNAIDQVMTNRDMYSLKAIKYVENFNLDYFVSKWENVLA